MIYNLVFLFVGLLVGGAGAWLICKYRFANGKNVPTAQFEELNAAFTELSTDKARLEEKVQGMSANMEAIKVELASERTIASETGKQLAQAQRDAVYLKEKIETQKSDFEQIQKKFTAEFENLANRIFDDKSKKFTDQNKQNMSDILKPLGEKIGEFQKKVEDTHVKESQQYAVLGNELKRLFELNQQVTKEANNLTNALKRESKTQGGWGEMILETILEKSGLVKGTHFVVQQSATTEEGRRLQPDVVVNLPEGKNVVVDSKVSLTAYERYFSCDNDEEKDVCLGEHLGSVKAHVKELSAKNYQNLYGINSPDFVLMFLPIEPAFGLAVLEEPGLFQEAFEKNVVIVAPSTLLATLRIISTIWRQEDQNRHAAEIARQSGQLYDKFVAFAEDLLEIGKRIQDAEKAYESASNKLNSGSGNLVKRVEHIRKLGAKTSKSLPQEILDKTEE